MPLFVHRFELPYLGKCRRNPVHRFFKIYIFCFDLHCVKTAEQDEINICSTYFGPNLTQDVYVHQFHDESLSYVKIENGQEEEMRGSPILKTLNQ